MEAIQVINKLLNGNSGVIRTADAVNVGISRATLGQLAKDGKLERIAHGRYIQPDVLPDELYLLQQRSRKIVFSHETALFLHDMAERTPLRHTLTIPSNGKLSPSLVMNKVPYSVISVFSSGFILISPDVQFAV